MSRDRAVSATAGDTSYQPTQADWAAFRDLKSRTILAEVPGAEIEGALRWIRLSPGTLLLTQGGEANSVFLVVRGRLDVFVRGENGATTHLGRISPGEAVGEVALLTGEERSASVASVRDTVLVRIHHEAFTSLLEAHPKALMRVTRLLAQRLLQGNRKRAARREPKVVALVGLEGPGDAQALAHALLGLEGLRVRRPSPGDAARVLGASDPGRLLSAWLDEAEQNADLILLECGGGPEGLAALYLAAADTVLEVAQASSAPPPPRPVGRQKRRELALLQPSHATLPTRGEVWSAAVDVDLIHHVRLDHRNDVARLGRLLTGRAIALAMAGGGARCAAHVGVIRAFEEAKIPIDIACGTSAGAVIGGLRALGLPASEIESSLRRAMYDRWMFDFTAPVVSLLGGKPVAKAMHEMFADRLIENTWIPYFCVSSNLSRAEVVIHDRGPLADAVRTSGAIPGVLPPERRGADLLVDGVLLNNLPGDLVQRVAPCRVVAVNLVPRVDPRASADLAFGASKLRTLARRVNPFGNKEQPPMVLDLVMRSLLLGAVSHAQRVAEQVEVFIEPEDIGQFGFFDVLSYDRMVDSGYRAAEKALAKWREDAADVPALEG